MNSHKVIDTRRKAIYKGPGLENHSKNLDVKGKIHNAVRDSVVYTGEVRMAYIATSTRTP